MEEMKSYLKGVLPFLSVTCAVFVYIEDYSENMQYNLWTSSCFAISKAVFAEICAFTTWKGLYHFKLVENEIFDLLIIHVLCILSTMVIMLPSLYWLLKLSLVIAILLIFLIIILLLGCFKPFKQLEMPASKACRRSAKIENNRTRNLPNESLDSNASFTLQVKLKGIIPSTGVLVYAENKTIFKKDIHKTEIPKVNLPMPSGASGDGVLLNSFSSVATELPKNPPTKRTSGRSEYLPALLNSTPTEPTSKSQELSKACISKSIQVGVSTTSLVESSTSTASSSWNPLAIGNREESRYNSTRTDSSLSQNRQMSVSQVPVSTQTSNLTPTSSAWKVLEYKTRNGKVIKAILLNEQTGISRPIDPDILYGSDGISDYTGNN